MTEKVEFQVQRRYPTSVSTIARDWHIADYVKRGEPARRLVFKTQSEAVKERQAMERRSARYGWGAEYRVVKVVTTYEVIA